jgi:hypothetical protein
LGHGPGNITVFTERRPPLPISIISLISSK